MKEKPKKEAPSPIGRCENCGKLVVLTKYTLCYDCRQKEMPELEKALAFLRTHPGASVNIIAEATGVKTSLVLKLIHGGHIELSNPDKKPKK